MEKTVRNLIIEAYRHAELAHKKDKPVIEIVCEGGVDLSNCIIKYAVLFFLYNTSNLKYKLLQNEL